jgi:hypothetical protein
LSSFAVVFLVVIPEEPALSEANGGSAFRFCLYPPAANHHDQTKKTHPSTTAKPAKHLLISSTKEKMRKNPSKNTCQAQK